MIEAASPIINRNNYYLIKMPYTDSYNSNFDDPKTIITDPSILNSFSRNNFQDIAKSINEDNLDNIALNSFNTSQTNKSNKMYDNCNKYNLEGTDNFKIKRKSEKEIW